MFVDQLLELYRAGILRRRAYDSLPLERRWPPDTRSALTPTSCRRCAAWVSARADEAQFADLQRHGVFREDIEFSAGRVRSPAGNGSGPTLATRQLRAHGRASASDGAA